jgi:hypothetical protein
MKKLVVANKKNGLPHSLVCMVNRMMELNQKRWDIFQKAER